MGHDPRAGLRSIALLEAAKGVLALVAATGMALHQDVRPLVNVLAAHLHLNPASDRPLALLHALEAGASPHLRLLGLGALIYAAIRLLEAVGLWRRRTWALWCGVLTGAIYIPFELVGFLRHPSALPLFLLCINGAVVVYLTKRVVGRRADA